MYDTFTMINTKHRGLRLHALKLIARYNILQTKIPFGNFQLTKHTIKH